MMDLKNCFTVVVATNVFEQAITVTAKSTNEVQLANSGLNLGKSNGQYLVVQCIEDFTNLTSLKISLRDDSATGMGSPRVVQSTEAILLAKCKAGNCLMNRKIAAVELQEFLDVYFTVAGSAADAGKVIAWIQEGPHDIAEIGNAT